MHKVAIVRIILIERPKSNQQNIDVIAKGICILRFVGVDASELFWRSIRPTIAPIDLSIQLRTGL